MHPCDPGHPLNRALSVPLRRPVSNAERLLNAARVANPGGPEGTVRYPRKERGDVLVAWDRVTKRYDVGTEARSIVQGRRGDVLKILASLIEGAS